MEHYLKLTVGLILSGMMSLSWAQDQTSDKVTPGLHFQFEKTPLYIPASSFTTSSVDNLNTGKRSTFIKQYGATLSIPVKHDTVSFDLGLDFRFYDSQQLSELTRRNGDGYGTNLRNLPAPMVYANALFELPFEGLTASVSGRHRNNGDQKFADFDYRAKLSYEWKNGLGLHGGWQHQQMTLDQNNDSEVFRVESLFVDMKYKF